MRGSASPFLLEGDRQGRGLGLATALRRESLTRLAQAAPSRARPFVLALDVVSLRAAVADMIDTGVFLAVVGIDLHFLPPGGRSNFDTKRPSGPATGGAHFSPTAAFATKVAYGGVPL